VEKKDLLEDNHPHGSGWKPARSIIISQEGSTEGRTSDKAGKRGKKCFDLKQWPSEKCVNTEIRRKIWQEKGRAQKGF